MLHRQRCSHCSQSLSLIHYLATARHPVQCIHTDIRPWLVQAKIRPSAGGRWLLRQDPYPGHFDSHILNIHMAKAGERLPPCSVSSARNNTRVQLRHLLEGFSPKKAQQMRAMMLQGCCKQCCGT